MKDFSISQLFLSKYSVLMALQIHFLHWVISHRVAALLMTTSILCLPILQHINSQKKIVFSSDREIKLIFCLLFQDRLLFLLSS